MGTYVVLCRSVDDGDLEVCDGVFYATMGIFSVSSKELRPTRIGGGGWLIEQREGGCLDEPEQKV